MNPLVDIEKEFVDPSHLEPKMLSHARVVRTSDIIKVPPCSPENVELLMIRDDVGLSTVSYLYQNTVRTRAWLEMWLEPLYRQYTNFWSSRDALLHVMQWHTPFISRAAVVSPKLLASYADPPDGPFKDELAYTDGDFTAVFRCDYNTEACKKEFQRFWQGRGRVKAQTIANK